MDAETYLRLQAETALRIPGGEYEKVRRFEPVMRALTMSGALDRDTADAIDTDLRLAIHARQPREKPRLSATFRHFGRRIGRLSARAVQAGRLSATPGPTLGAPASTAFLSASAGTRAPAPRPAALAPPAPATPPAAAPPPPPLAPDRAVPLDATLPIRSSELRGNLHLLSYVHDASGARLSYAGPVTTTATMTTTHTFRGMRQFALAAADEQGNRYEVRFGSSSMSNGHWNGELTVRPDPPPDIRWIDLGEPPVRIDLAGGSPADIDVTMNPATLSPAEHYVHRLAAELLAGQHDRDDALAAVTALLTVGALTPDNPVLTAFNALTAGLPRADLPEQWRLAPEPPTPARHCYAGLAAILPEIDGARITLLDLHTEEGDAGTAVQVHVANAGWPHQMPWLLWLRDAAGWHATGPWSGGGSDTEMRLRYPVIPPLRPGDWIEVLVIGLSAEVRARVPVRWRMAGNAS